MKTTIRTAPVCSALVAVAMCAATLASADAPKVLEVVAQRDGMGWRFEVTVQHPDTGWDHYVTGWEVLGPNGKVLAVRKLHHPHETEQPFTRSLNSVMVPDGVKDVFIRTKCSRDGWSTTDYKVELDK